MNTFLTQSRDITDISSKHRRDKTSTSLTHHPNQTDTSLTQTQDITDTPPRQNRDITKSITKTSLNHRWDIIETSQRPHRSIPETSTKHHPHKTHTSLTQHPTQPRPPGNIENHIIKHHQLYRNNTETSPKHQWDTTVTKPKQDRNITKASPWHHGDITETPPKRHWNITATSAKHYENETETSPWHHRNNTETSPKHHHEIPETSAKHYKNKPETPPWHPETSPTQRKTKTDTSRRQDRDTTDSMNFSILKLSPSTYGSQLHWFAQRCAIYKFKMEFSILLKIPIKMFINVHHQTIKTPSRKQKKSTTQHQAITHSSS